ncbi:tyrosine-type recombinase/integrase [Paenibacillus rhizoplanae]|uniref:Tyrosine-type recombinase/integrase n=1 Tax=Paenibacillus rhizoplanae TaxID=1917181 RepID=A0ABW5FAW3_9BACL
MAFSLAIYTGMRRGEILGLRWKDIDFEKKELKVIQTANWTRDGLVIQRVKLFQNIIDDLQERYSQIEAYKKDYGEAYEDKDLVCCYPVGGYINPKQITEVNPKVASERLRMTSAMFNERYSHLLPIMQEEAVDRIENELNKFAEKQLQPGE